MPQRLKKVERVFSFKPTKNEADEDKEEAKKMPSPEGFIATMQVSGVVEDFASFVKAMNEGSQHKKSTSSPEKLKKKRKGRKSALKKHRLRARHSKPRIVEKSLGLLVSTYPTNLALFSMRSHSEE